MCLCSTEQKPAVAKKYSKPVEIYEDCRQIWQGKSAKARNAARDAVIAAVKDTPIETKFEEDQIPKNLKEWVQCLCLDLDSDAFESFYGDLAWLATLSGTMEVKVHVWTHLNDRTSILKVMACK